MLWANLIIGKGGIVSYSGEGWKLRALCAHLDEDYHMGKKMKLLLVILVMLSLLKDDQLWVTLAM